MSPSNGSVSIADARTPGSGVPNETHRVITIDQRADRPIEVPGALELKGRGVRGKQISL